MKGGWAVWRNNKKNELHVVPEGETHDCEQDCWCKPRRDERVWVHNSLDGRERYETG